MSNKRILQVVDSLSMGGAERVVMTLSQGFVDIGHNIDIITIHNRLDFETIPQINFYSIDFQKKLFDYILYERKLHQFINKLEKENGNYDLILVHLQKSTRLMHRFKHSNLFFCIHSTLSKASLEGRIGLRRLMKKRKLQLIYNKLNLITVSDGIAKDLIDIVGIRPKTIQTIYNPVDIERIKKLSLEEHTYQNDSYIIHVGRLAKSKRHDKLIEAYAKSGVDEKLLIVGEGEMRSVIEEKIKTLGLEDKIILTGFQSNPYPMIKDARLLVLSSDYEGLPTVLIEALALGTAVVSTDCPSGPREILVPFMADALVALDDEDALAEAMYSYVLIPTIDFEKVVSRFELQTVVNKYLQLI